MATTSALSPRESAGGSGPSRSSTAGRQPRVIMRAEPLRAPQTCEIAAGRSCAIPKIDRCCRAGAEPRACSIACRRFGGGGVRGVGDAYIRRDDHLATGDGDLLKVGFEQREVVGR